MKKSYYFLSGIIGMHGLETGELKMQEADW